MYTQAACKGSIRVHCWLLLLLLICLLWQNSYIHSLYLIVTPCRRNATNKISKKLPNQNCINIPMQISMVLFVANSKLSTKTHKQISFHIFTNLNHQQISLLINNQFTSTLCKSSLEASQLSCSDLHFTIIMIPIIVACNVSHQRFWMYIYAHLEIFDSLFEHISSVLLYILFASEYKHVFFTYYFVCVVHIQYCMFCMSQCTIHTRYCTYTIAHIYVAICILIIYMQNNINMFW